MLKRENPFTPEPVSAGIGKKKTREYVSPIAARTPLRNVLASGGGSRLNPLRDVEGTPTTPLNDDEEERRANRAAMVKDRRRMKKTILSPAIGMTPKATPPTSIAPRGIVNGTPTLINTDVANKPIAAPILTAEQRAKRFEEWMKIAADNKINAKNSWNVALIDYFSEMTFLRDGDSINFQRASCTLDGCVKIYSTRVDSCADETGKLLNGLAEGKKSRFGMDLVEEGNNLLEEKDPDAAFGGTKGKSSSRRPHRAVDTLERTFESLNMKQFEMEYAADPLFKKTCAEFDESGAKGFLTSELSMAMNGRLLLDSTDSNHIPTTDQEDDQDSGLDDVKIDFSSLLQLHGKALMEIENRIISPTLSNYSFGNVDLGKLDRQLSETMARLATLSTAMEVESDDDDDDSGDMGFTAPVDFTADTIPFDEGTHDDFTYDQELSDMVNPSLIQNITEIAQNAFNPTTMMSQRVEMMASEDATPAFLAYFDSNRQNRNWAGPEHWKVQRPHLNRTIIPDSKPQQRQAKKEFVLEFDVAPIDMSKIFVKANPATITYSKSAMDDRNEKDNLLPEDLKFSSNEFLKLFIKPSWTIGRKITTVVVEDEGIEERPDLVSNEVTPAFWANPENVLPTLDNNEAFNQDQQGFDDGGGYSDYDDGDSPTGDLTPITDEVTMPGRSLGSEPVQSYKTQPTLSIQYARKAKKVDVQELKRVLWEEIESIPKMATNSKDKSDSSTTFSQLVHGLEGTNLPKDTMQDLSVSYCFICLLHLANEHNLQLTTNVTGELLVASQ